MEQDGDGQQLEALQRQAAKRGREYEKEAAKAPAPGTPAFVDYSRRAFYKEFVKVGASCTPSLAGAAPSVPQQAQAAQGPGGAGSRQGSIADRRR